MRVLHLISGGDTGGAKTHILTLLHELNKHIEVELLCVMESVFTQEARDLSIPVTVIPQKKRCNVFVVKKMIQFIKENDVKILHCHGARANFLAILIKPWIDIPIITTIHSDYKLDFTNNKYKHLFYTPINSFALRLIPYYIAVTDTFRDMLIERGFKKDRIYEVYNGISFDEKITTKSKTEFLKEFGVPLFNEYIYVGHVGRLHPVKGVDVFLKGAIEILKVHSNVIFLIAGDGEEKEKYLEFIYKNNLKENVFLLGHVDDMTSFYDTIDINVLASYSESFPYALLEGARHKKPTISSAVGGIPKMIRHGETGFLFNSGDYNALAQNVIKLLENDSLRSEIGEKFYKGIKRDYSAGSMAKRHIEIYKQILERR